MSGSNLTSMRKAVWKIWIPVYVLQEWMDIMDDDNVVVKIEQDHVRQQKTVAGKIGDYGTHSMRQYQRYFSISGCLKKNYSTVSFNVSSRTHSMTYA